MSTRTRHTIQAYALAAMLALATFYGYGASMTEAGPFIAGYAGTILPAAVALWCYFAGRIWR